MISPGHQSAFHKWVVVGAAIATLFAVAGVSHATPIVQSRQATTANTVPVYKQCTEPNSFALTFDDGPYHYAPALDQLLAQNNASASFFFNGYNWGCIYDFGDVIRQRFLAGHLIANHGWSHAHMGSATADQVTEQLELVETALIMILGVKPLYFRAPYGEGSDVMLQVLAQRGYKGLILWNEDSGDSFVPTPSVSTIINSYANFTAQSIVLSHETYDWTVNHVMPSVVPSLVARGLKLVTVPECLGLGSNISDWYEFVAAPSPRNSSWTCNGTPAPGQL